MIKITHRWSTCRAVDMEGAYAGKEGGGGGDVF